MEKVNKNYQYLVKDIIVEKGGFNRSDETETTKEVVVINFNKTKVPIFKYVPKYCEVKDLLDLTVNLRGKAEVERELGIKIKEVKKK